MENVLLCLMGYYLYAIVFLCPCGFSLASYLPDGGFVPWRSPANQITRPRVTVINRGRCESAVFVDIQNIDVRRAADILIHACPIYIYIGDESIGRASNGNSCQIQARVVHVLLLCRQKSKPLFRIPTETRSHHIRAASGFFYRFFADYFADICSKVHENENRL